MLELSQPPRIKPVQIYCERLTNLCAWKRGNEERRPEEKRGLMVQRRQMVCLTRFTRKPIGAGYAGTAIGTFRDSLLEISVTSLSFGWLGLPMWMPPSKNAPSPTMMRCAITSPVTEPSIRRCCWRRGKRCLNPLQPELSPLTFTH
jgi:hypothetical protein